MNVGVYQAGQKRYVTEIQHFGSMRMVHRGAGFCDAIILDKNFAGRNDSSCLNIQKPRGVQHHNALRRGQSGLRARA